MGGVSSCLFCATPAGGDRLHGSVLGHDVESQGGHGARAGVHGARLCEPLDVRVCACCGAIAEHVEHYALPTCLCSSVGRVRWSPRGRLWRAGMQRVANHMQAARRRFNGNACRRRLSDPSKCNLYSRGAARQAHNTTAGSQLSVDCRDPGGCDLLQRASSQAVNFNHCSMLDLTVRRVLQHSGSRD